MQHRSQRVTFEMPRGQQEKPQDPDYLFNTMIMEISNNWEFVLDLMDRFYDKKIQGIQSLPPIEREWLTFIINNKIPINIYKEDSEKFFESHFKNKEPK